jgi:hypothetical protein
MSDVNLTRTAGTPGTKRFGGDGTACTAGGNVTATNNGVAPTNSREADAVARRLGLLVRQTASVKSFSIL